jgi:F-type H+-transporting ATPase subunit alpha
MKIDATEISEILKQQISGYSADVDLSDTGTVIEAGDGIARVYGLTKAMAGELLEFPHETMGLVLNLEVDNVAVALLGD